jgi:hypothetical protein
MSSNEKKIKKQHKVFSTDEKMQILAKADAHVGTRGGSSGNVWFVRTNVKHDSESSQSPTNALNIRCSPYKTYDYIKYMKI